MNVGETLFKISLTASFLVRSAISLCLFYAIGEVSTYSLKVALLVMFTGYATLSVYGLYRNIKAFFALKKLLDNVN